MSTIHRTATSMFFCLLAGSGLGQTPPAKPFTPDWESLKKYQCPEWFRDAKFGIWAHWGPQSVPMDGDWYARHLYTQGHRPYQHHLQTYGNPSEPGFKDNIPPWKAEHRDAERVKGIISDLLGRELDEEIVEEEYSVSQKLRMILETVIFGWFIPGKKRRRVPPES